MKLLFRTLLVFGFFALVATSCERDDICAKSTPTTPQLVISFYDVEDPTQAKPINLAVYEPGGKDTLKFSNDTIVKVPLRTDSDRTTFIFTKNPNISTAADEPDNKDQVTFLYNTNQVYIDRACGFKVTYDGLTYQKIPLDDSAWIDRIQIINSTIVNEDTTHVNIIH